MKKSLGINDRFLYSDDCLHLTALKESGFDAIDYTMDWSMVLEENGEGKIEKIRRKLEEAGI